MPNSLAKAGLMHSKIASNGRRATTDADVLGRRCRQLEKRATRTSRQHKGPQLTKQNKSYNEYKRLSDSVGPYTKQHCRPVLIPHIENFLQEYKVYRVAKFSPSRNKSKSVPAWPRGRHDLLARGLIWSSLRRWGGLNGMERQRAERIHLCRRLND